MNPRNLLSPLPPVLPEEQFETLAQGCGSFRLERIISRQHTSPPGFWYDQDSTEWVLLLSGSALLLLQAPDGQVQPCPLRPGDFLEIPANCRHRVEETAEGVDTVWLALHAIPAPLSGEPGTGTGTGGPQLSRPD